MSMSLQACWSRTAAGLPFVGWLAVAAAAVSLAIHG